MPYLEQRARKELENKKFSAETPGELNYLFTKEIIGYLKIHGLSYKTCNDVIGALDACKMEFYRRIVAPYENKKILENGDVYDNP